MKQPELFNEGPSQKLYRDLLDTGQETVWACDWDIDWPSVTECHLNIMGILESTLCRKCEQEEEHFCHILCQCPPLARYKQENSSSECLEPVYIRTSVRIVLTLALQSGLFVEKSQQVLGEH
jgi:hypothetical protein